jgi:hypothetical protein
MPKFDKTRMAISIAAKIAASNDKLKLPSKPRYTEYEKAVEAYTLLRHKLNCFTGLAERRDVYAMAGLAKKEFQISNPDAYNKLMQCFIDCELNRPILNLICWQLAGNRKRAKDGHPIDLFNNRPDEAGWMSGAIVDLTVDSETQKDCYKVKLVDGPGAGFIVCLPMDFKRLKLLSHVLGVVRRNGKDRYYMSDLRQAVGMRLNVYLTKGWSAHGFEALYGKRQILTPINMDMVHVIKCSADHKRHNKALLDTRNSPCPAGKTCLCHDCEVGYDHCDRGCRPTTIRLLPETELLIKGKNICQMICEDPSVSR